MDYYLHYVLDSTMTTLEPVWKPVLTTGGTFANDNPAGLTFVLDRLAAGRPRARQAQHAGLPGAVVAPGRRSRRAARRSTLSPPRTARRCCARSSRPSIAWTALPAARGSADLMQLLGTLSPQRSWRPSGPRSSAWRARPATTACARARSSRSCRSTATAGPAWQLTSTSPRLRIDLLRGATRLAPRPVARQPAGVAPAVAAGGLRATARRRPLPRRSPAATSGSCGPGAPKCSA